MKKEKSMDDKNDRAIFESARSRLRAAGKANSLGRPTMTLFSCRTGPKDRMHMPLHSKYVDLQSHNERTRFN